MNTMNKLFFLFLIGHALTTGLRADFPTWFTDFVTKDLTLLSTSSRVIEIAGLAFQLPFSKKYFGYDEPTLLSMFHTQLQIEISRIQKVANLNNLFKEKGCNKHWENLSLVQQMIITDVLLKMGEVKHNQSS